MFLILLRAETELTSEFLAKELDVTSRTIKSYFKQMKPALAEEGILLESKRGTGYALSYQENGLLNELKTYFQLYQPRKSDTEIDLRVTYLIKRLLTSEKPLKLEDLAQELFLSSTGALVIELKLAEELLDLYQLKLVRHRQQGLVIDGEGFAKLMCGIKLCRYFNERTTKVYHVAAFDALFTSNQQEYSKIRNIMLNTLIPLDLVFSDLYVERYILLLLFFRC